MRVALFAVLAAAVLLAALVLLQTSTSERPEDETEQLGNRDDDAVQATPNPSHRSGEHLSAQETEGQREDTTSQPLAPAAPIEKTRLEPARFTHISGFARDGDGAPLVGHRIEIQRADGEIEGRADTGRDGSFRIDGLLPGPRVLRLLGPGDGDVLSAHIGRPWGSECGVELVQEERRLNLTLPSYGLERVALIVRGHGARLIRFRLVDDVQRPLGSCIFRFENAFGIRSIDDHPDIETRSDEDGAVCVPILVEQEQSVRLSLELDVARDVLGRLAGGDEAEASSPRYLPVEVPLRAKPVVQDLGTLVMPRMAGLLVTLVDGTTGAVVGDAVVKVHCSGGGLAPTDERGQLDREFRHLVWSERASGEYDLTVEAAGYRTVWQKGVLVAGDEPLPVEIALERSR